jgi:hypothetical protein
MHKYKVILHGQNVLTEVDGVRKRLSFYTNVFVEAFNVGDAETRAVTLLMDDSGLRKSSSNSTGDPVRFSVEEVHELESFDGVQLPRTGLAFYEA